MTTTTIHASFSNDVKTVWQIVTSLTNYTWRSDISRIKIIEPQKQFIEYAKNGYPTAFTITVLKPYQRYEFDLENDNMRGHWIGLFTYENGITTIDFTENITAKKVFFKPLIKLYLKKQQTIYINDLKKVLKTKQTV